MFLLVFVVARGVLSVGCFSLRVVVCSFVFLSFVVSCSLCVVVCVLCVVCELSFVACGSLCDVVVCVVEGVLFVLGSWLFVVLCL